MKTYAIHHDPYTEQAHADFNDLMERVQLLICNAYAEATKDGERQALMQFEIEIAEAVTAPDICAKIDGVRAALKRRYITDL